MIYSLATHSSMGFLSNLKHKFSPPSFITHLNPVHTITNPFHTIVNLGHPDNSPPDFSGIFNLSKPTGVDNSLNNPSNKALEPTGDEIDQQRLVLMKHVEHGLMVGGVVALGSYMLARVDIVSSLMFGGLVGVGTTIVMVKQ